MATPFLDNLEWSLIKKKQLRYKFGKCERKFKNFMQADY